MTTIGERVKQLRKELKLTQIDFGGRIAVSQGHLTAMENGKREVTDKTVKVICMEFNVNEKWLRTGEGQMFAETNETILSELASEYRLEGERYNLIRNFLMLTDEQQEAIARAMLPRQTKKRRQKPPKRRPLPPPRKRQSRPPRMCPMWTRRRTCQRTRRSKPRLRKSEPRCTQGKRRECL